MTSRVTLSVEQGIAQVCLNRAEKLNGLDLEMFEAISKTGDEVRADPSVRAVVLSGEGRAFCAGLDFKSVLAAGDGIQTLMQRREGEPVNLAQRVAWIWTQVKAPVIAALHGEVFGGGLQIALGADIRIARPDAKLSAMEAKWGLVPDMTGIPRMRKFMREDVARELCYTARVISGEEAHRTGLVTHLHDEPAAEATRLAEQIATRSPHAVQAAKQLFEDESTYEERLRLEESLQVSLFGSPNQMESIAANLEKRAPKFENP